MGQESTAEAALGAGAAEEMADLVSNGLTTALPLQQEWRAMQRGLPHLASKVGHVCLEDCNPYWAVSQQLLLLPLQPQKHLFLRAPQLSGAGFEAVRGDRNFCYTSKVWTACATAALVGIHWKQDDHQKSETINLDVSSAFLYKVVVKNTTQKYLSQDML